jgi:hypothetical protein
MVPPTVARLLAAIILPALEQPSWWRVAGVAETSAMMKRSHAAIGAAAGVAVAHATGDSLVAGGIVAVLAGSLSQVLADGLTVAGVPLWVAV